MISLVIIICGLLTGVIGREYEIRKAFSLEERMAADTDFIGFEWVLLGMTIISAGTMGLLFTGLIFTIYHIIQAWKRHKEQQE